MGLNKGEQQNSPRCSVFFNRLGEIRDRSYKNQRYRASGLNLLVAAIILWNTVYLQRASITSKSKNLEPTDLVHLSPLGWEHINLTGDCHWDAEQLMAPTCLALYELFYRKSRGRASRGMEFGSGVLIGPGRKTMATYRCSSAYFLIQSFNILIIFCRIAQLPSLLPLSGW